MGAGGRRAAWVVLGMSLAACAPKRGIEAPEVEGLDGTWWVMESGSSRAQGRLEIDGRVMTLLAPGQEEGSSSWNLHPDRGEWEAIGPGGAVVRIDPSDDGRLFVYAADGRLGVAERARAVPGALAGQWIVRDPERPQDVEALTLVPAASGRFSLVAAKGASATVWALGGGDSWSLVLDYEDGRTKVVFIHALPGEQWLLYGDTPGHTRFMHRPDAGPSWLR